MRPLAPPSRLAAALAAAGAVMVLAVGCGSSSSSGTAASSTSAPVTSVTTTTTTSGAGSTGSTLDSFPPGTVAVDVNQTTLGVVLVDGTGYTIYAFGPDTSGTPTCVDPTCTATWEPVTGTGIAVSAEVGTRSGLFKLVPRPDGTQQLAVAGHPVYRYSGDTKPGDANGQGIGGQWFALAPDGTVISS